MSKQHFDSHWKRILAALLVLLTVAGLFPAAALAAEAEETSAYAPTGDFELNVAGATGWNGTSLPLPVYASETGSDVMVTVPASDDAGPVPFMILADNGGDRVQIGLVGDSDGNVVAWEGDIVDGIGWVDKEYIFINLPDVVPSIAYNLTNAGGSVFTAAGGTDIPNVTGEQFYPQGMQFNPRLGREEYIVPCMYTLAERLAKAQKSAMSNGDTLVIYETFRPAAVQSAVRDGLRSLIASNSVVSADMKKASSMGYGEGWFISSGTSHHQSGLAVDVSLAKGDAATLQEYEMNGVVYRKYGSWTEYDMPSRMHELSSAAIRFKTPADSNAMPSNLENWTDSFAASEGAKRLQIYCTTAGLIPLSSEWWHFNDPNAAKIAAKGKFSKDIAVNTKGGYTFDRIDSVTPMTALTLLVPWAAPLADGPTGGAGGLNPGSAGGSKPGSTNVSWSTSTGRTFLRFTLIEFPKGVVTDLGKDDYGTFHTVGTPLNIVWGRDSGGTTYNGDYVRSNYVWFNSNAMWYNGNGTNAPSLMAGMGVTHGVYSYDASAGDNQRWVMTADEFQAATGISDTEKDQMFNLDSGSWSSGWLNGDYTSMWGTDPKPVTPGNLYTVYTPNKAFLYLLNRLSEMGSSNPGWSEENAIRNWSSFTQDDDGNLRTRYRIIVETGAIIKDPDGNRRAMTLRDVMAYTLYNNEPNERYNLIYDQTPTSKNMAQWMRQAITQFVEYPLDSSGQPTGEELFSTNGFTEADSFVDSISSVREIRDKIFSERRSFGLHIFSPFNFVMEIPEPTTAVLEVTKKTGAGITDGGPWGFTVKYTGGSPVSFTAKKGDTDCTGEVSDTGSGLHFTLAKDETIRIEFTVDSAFSYEVSEDDSTDLTDITGTGGTADKANNRFTGSSGSAAKVTFTNDRGGTPAPEKKPVFLKLKKIAKADGSPLSGAVFSVYADASCSGSPLATMTTSGDGTAVVSVPNIVEDGGSVTLYVKETSAPSGYTASDTVYTVTCTAPANSTEAGAVQIGPATGIENAATEVEEPPKEGPSEPIVYKRDALTNGGVGPATFKFSSVTNGVYEFTTDENGELEKIQWWDTSEAEGRYIKPGEYTVTELIPPPGYEPTSEVQQIKLELDEDGSGIPAGPLVFKNLQKVGLRIVKYDRLSHTPMAGVTFEIYKDGQSIGRYETNANGEILLTDLEPGTYRAVEVDTGDEGHILNSSYQEIELVAGEGTKDVIFFNDKKPGMKLVKVDSDDPSRTIAGAVFEIRSVEGIYGPQEFTTDGNGEIDLSMLPEGAYVVTEKSCPGYIIDSAQRIIHLKPNDVAEFVFTNTKNPTLRLVKTSADGTPMEGVTFRIARIEDGSHYLDRTTNAQGEIEIDGLEPGVYSVVETATLPDHILDTTEHHVELSPGKTSEIRLSNDKRPTLVISKTDKDTGEPVPGVTFTLRGADGPTITTLSTGPDGKVTITDLLPGVYTVIEQSVPENYILDTTPQTVTLFPNREAQVEFQNHQRPTLKIAKVDINGKFLTGAIFEVKTKAGVKIGDFPVGADGTITVPNIHLDEGYYIITEIQAPEGYILDSTPHEVYLRPGKTTEVSIENQKKPGLTIYKIDSVTGDGVQGAKFEIWVSKDKNQNGTYQQLTSTYYYSDASGVIHLDNLDPGWYKIVEVEPAAGYSIKEPHEQVVYVEHDATVTVTFENTPLNAIVVEKYDSVTHEALPGCTFQLRYLGGTSGTGGTVIGQKVTGKNGMCIWTGLQPGTYIVEEVDPADGYSIINASETVYLADNGEQSVITVRFDNAPDGILLIRKVCAVNPSVTLQDAEFKVMYADGPLIGDSNGIYRTDENGEIRIEGLKPGKSVVVTETKAPAGFIIDTQSQTIQIKEGRTVSLTFKNQPKGGIIIQKRDSITGEPLPGAQFRVTTAAGCEVGLDGVLGDSTLTQSGVFTTDSSGEIRISNLAPGAYVITEIKAPAGYVMDSPSTNVVIGANGDTQTVIITNTPKGNLIVEKYDSVTRQPLKDAEFKITTANGELVADNEGMTSSNGLYSTDENGQIVLSKLLPGTYIVTETRAPDNYRTDPKSQTVVVNAGDTQTLRFYNDPLCTLTILKRDAVTKKPLAMAEFLVRDSEGRAVGPNNGIYTTGSDGTVTVTGLEPNATIVVSEVKAPTGYILDQTPKNIVVRIGVANSLIFDDQPGTTLIIRKFIEGTENEPLSGVAFKVVDGSGAAVGPDDGVYYTDKAGEIVLEGIEPGTTVIAREIKTVEGFILDGTPQDILIKGGEVQQLTYWNKRAGTLVIVKKDSVTGALIPGAQFQLTYASGGYVDNDNGHLSSNGLYTTDANGEIRITGITGTVVVKEIQAAPGYVIDQSTQTQTVTVNPLDTQTLTFLNDPLCSLVITKLDSVTGKPVPGTVFTVKDGNGNLLGTYTTGADGTVTVTGLVPGSTVVVTETKVPSGYVLNTTPQTIIVQNGTSSLVSGSASSSGGAGWSGNGLVFENDPTMTLTIHKYIDGTANEPLAGVAFRIVDGSGAPVGSGDGVFYTDAAGKIVVEGLEPGTTVTAQEIKTVDGFVLDGTPKSVKITASDTAPSLTFWNKRAGNLIIRKLDSITKKPLAGVEFQVTYTDGSFVDLDGGKVSSKGIYTTNSQGEIVISGIVGSIVITETKTIPGYTINESERSQTVKVNPNDTQTVTFYNLPTASLVIQKYIAGTENEPLANVEFLVTDVSGAGVGANNGYYTTDRNGRIVIDGLADGDVFTVKETRTADGFLLDGLPQTIKVRSGEASTLTFWNERMGGLIIHKLDSETLKPLAGVQFRITYADGSFVDAEGGKLSSNGLYVTDKNGQIRLSGIVGTLVVTEEKTIDGYIIDELTRSQTVVVNADDTQELTFYNQPTQTLIIEKLVEGTKDEPLAGVEFLISDSDGTLLGPSNGVYRTDKYGRIYLYDLEPGTVITAKETKTLEGFVLDSTPQSIEIRSGEVQYLRFYNTRVGGLELIKVSEADKTQRIPGVTFEIRRMDGGLVDTVTTGDNGRIYRDLDAGYYYLVEIAAPKEFKVDSTPHYFEVVDGKTSTVTVTNKPFSGILIHKTSSLTGKGIYGVTFLLYDSTNTPIGQYTSDNNGYVYIEGLTTSGRYFLREMENKGYIVDTEMKTVYVTAGETTLIEWKNTPITGQIQITKTSADYNSMNGWPTGTALPDVEFEIYDKANNLVDTIRTNANGIASSSPLPLGRYTVVESKAADFYGLDKTPMEAEIEFAGQIVRLSMTNKSLFTNVSITKRGYAQVMPGQSIRYDFSNIGNNSTVPLTSFYWRDTLPTQAVRLEKIITGTYNVQGNYKIVYRTNLSGDTYRTLADSLNTQQNYSLAASPAALGLASNECVTEFMFVFGTVPANFRQVEAPAVYCNVLSGLTNGTQFSNQADVGGMYNGQWIMATDRWVTTVYAPAKSLPRTGY